MPVDPMEFRRVVGSFVTGVTVVTAAAGDQHHAMTVSSFTSVSLDPLLVLASIERVSRFHEVIVAADAFAVNVLTVDQEPLSRLFATRGRAPDSAALQRFPHHVGRHSSAIVLDESLAVLECRRHSVLDGGDHSLVVGEVVGLATPRPDASPLLYYESDYRQADLRPTQPGGG